MISRLVLTLVLLPDVGAALEFRNCDKAQIAFADAAVVGAQQAALVAAAAVADDADYAHWFGAHTPANAEEVRRGLKAVVRALSDPELTIVCPVVSREGCSSDLFGYVYSDGPLEVNLCAAFFGQPTLAGIVPTSSAFETGTREGTIIHEVSHFETVAGTEDHCYGRTDCPEMAKQSPGLVIENADSFQYYVEDIVLGREGRLAR